MLRPASGLISADRRLRVDDVGCLPQRAGYPLPRPHLPQLLRQLGDQLAQRRQVQHSRLAADVRYPSRPRGLGRAARLVSDAADDDVGQARSLGRADVLDNVRAGRRIRGSTWLRILRTPSSPRFRRLADMTCITGRNASRPASFSTAITSQSRSGLSWPTCRQARGLRWWLVVSAGVVMAETRRATPGRCGACAPPAIGSPTPDDYPPTAWVVACTSGRQRYGLRAYGLAPRGTANGVFTPLGGCRPGVVMLAWYQHHGIHPRCVTRRRFHAAVARRELACLRRLLVLRPGNQGRQVRQVRLGHGFLREGRRGPRRWSI